MVDVKKKLLNIILLIKTFSEKLQKISTETYLRKKKKQEENKQEIDIETSQKMKKNRLTEYERKYQPVKK